MIEYHYEHFHPRNTGNTVVTYVLRNRWF